MYQVRAIDSRLRHIQKDFLTLNQAREYAHSVKKENPNSTICVYRKGIKNENERMVLVLANK